MPPARILVLDDDPGIIDFVTHALRRHGFEAQGVEHPKDALAQARGEPFDLIVVDVNLPGMNGFEFRSAFRKIAGRERTPIVFLSGADTNVEMAIAKELQGDRLMLKPLPEADLLRHVNLALGTVRSDRGPIPGALDRILAQVAAEKETGILTALAGTTVKRVVFHQGNVAFAASNDPREVIGQAFVRSGLVSEKDLAAAFAHRESAGPGAGAAPIGTVLAALRKVTPEQCQRVFERKVRESVLDLFLWNGGMVEYASGGVQDADRPFPISLELPPLRVEGLKRRIKWAEVRRRIPDPSVCFERPGGRWAKGFPRNEGDKLLAAHIEAGRSMAEILVELRGQDFAVGSRLLDLLKSGVIQPTESSGFAGALVFESVTIDIDEELAAMEAQETEPTYQIDLGDEDIVEAAPTSTRVLSNPLPPLASTASFASSARAHAAEPELLVEPLPDEGPTVARLTRALVLFRAGDLLGARENLVEVLTIDPTNPLARQRIVEIDQALAVKAASEGIRPEAILELAVPLEKLVGTAVPPNDAFVLTRLAGGALSVADLIRICPLPQNEILSLLQRYLVSGILKHKS